MKTEQAHYLVDTLVVVPWILLATPDCDCTTSIVGVQASKASLLRGELA
jgi:hypothetical protein